MRLTMKALTVASLIFSWLLPRAAVAQIAVDPQASSAMPDSIRSYLLVALSKMKEVSLHRDSVNWSALQDSVLTRARYARRPDETWRTLQWALRSVDPHSFLQTPHPMPPTPGPAGRQTTPATTPQAQGSNASRPGPVVGRLIDGRFGYVKIPWFVGSNRPSFVDSVRAFISEQDRAGACGWIIDLRGNSGGNMWPMVSGLAPLLGDTIFGFFARPGQPLEPWRERAGHTWSGDASEPDWGGRGSSPPSALRNPLAPVAVLTARNTASSGEATLIAFRGRPNVRSFGDTTAGFNSVNDGVRLSDGAQMVVTVGYNRDRSGAIYSLRISPDEYVSMAADSTAPIARAAAWLGGQSACKRPD